jgi:hypothetical protein
MQSSVPLKPALEADWWRKLSVSGYMITLDGSLNRKWSNITVLFPRTS